MKLTIDKKLTTEKADKNLKGEPISPLNKITKSLSINLLTKKGKPLFSFSREKVNLTKSNL